MFASNSGLYFISSNLHVETEKSFASNSLLEDVRPSSPDKVPRQRLTNHVLGNVDDGGGSVLLPDLFWIQGVLQVPEQVEVSGV